MKHMGDLGKRAVWVGFVVGMGLWVTTAVWAGHVLEVGPGHAYSTVQSAVNAAQPGDAIRVYPSTYPESVSVTRSHISILAQGQGVVVGPPPNGNEACFDVQADGVVIDGFGLTGTSCAPAISFVGSYNRFCNNRIYGLICPGVNALECRAPTGGSNYNVIQNNNITGADLGIVVGSDTKNAVNKGNAIVGNTIFNMGTVGITVYNAVGTTITGNVIDGVAYGIGISLSTTPGKQPQHSHVVTGNTITNVAGGGIAVFADKPSTLTDVFVGFNQISSSASFGILLQESEGGKLTACAVTGNDVRTAADAGIDLEPGVNKNTVEGNLALDNGDYGVLVRGNHNTIQGNTSLGSNQLDVIDAGKNNHWKDNVYQTSSWSR